MSIGQNHIFSGSLPGLSWGEAVGLRGSLILRVCQLARSVSESLASPFVFASPRALWSQGRGLKQTHREPPSAGPMDVALITLLPCWNFLAAFPGIWEKPKLLTQSPEPW